MHANSHAARLERAIGFRQSLMLIHGQPGRYHFSNAAALQPQSTLLAIAGQII